MHHTSPGSAECSETCSCKAPAQTTAYRNTLLGHILKLSPLMTSWEGWASVILCGLWMWWLKFQADLREGQRSVWRKWREEGRDGQKQDIGEKDGWRYVERSKEGERGHGAGITNEGSLLFSQLFFLVPWAVLCTRPETLGMLNGPSLPLPYCKHTQSTHTLSMNGAWTHLKNTSLCLTWNLIVTMVVNNRVGVGL